MINRLENKVSSKCVSSKKKIIEWERHSASKIGLINDNNEEEYLQESDEGQHIGIGMITPLGIVPTSKNFKLYQCHTNFKITEAVFDIVQNADGVEGIIQLSPYRLTVGIAKLFDDEDVKFVINKNLNDYFTERDKCNQE